MWQEDKSPYELLIRVTGAKTPKDRTHKANEGGFTVTRGGSGGHIAC